MVSALISFIGIIIVIYVYLCHANKFKRKDMNPGASNLEHGQTLSLEEAKDLAEKIIADGARFICIEHQGFSPSGAFLGELTREFFLKYPELRSKNGGFRLSALGICPSEYIDNHISIGRSEDWDIVQRPGDDRVYVVEGGESSGENANECFKSVYHLIVDEARV